MSNVSNEDLAVDFAVLKNDVKHLTESVERLTEAMSETNKNVAAINGTLSEATGGWRVLMAVGGASGAVGAGLSSLAHLLVGKTGP